jgi:hypothetical protein
MFAAPLYKSCFLSLAPTREKLQDRFRAFCLVEVRGTSADLRAIRLSNSSQRYKSCCAKNLIGAFGIASVTEEFAPKGHLEIAQRFQRWMGMLKGV